MEEELYLTIVNKPDTPPCWDMPVQSSNHYKPSKQKAKEVARRHKRNKNKKTHRKKK